LQKNPKEASKPHKGEGNQGNYKKNTLKKWKVRRVVEVLEGVKLF
jgi:hypothetical protein